MAGDGKAATVQHSAGEDLVGVVERIEAESHVSAGRLQGRPAARTEGDDRFVHLAAELGEVIGGRATDVDSADRFPAESYEDLRRSGYLALPVPKELGGAGATVRQLCYAQAELARHCGSTALAVSMHLHLALSSAWRWRQGDAAENEVLERVASEGLVLLTSLGSDGVYPTGLAVRAGDGYRVTGRKRFCSGASAGGLLTTAAFTGEYEAGAVVEFQVPLSASGVALTGDWKALGMRGSGSCDIEFDDVWIPAAAIKHRRQWGEMDGSLRLTLLHMNLLTSAVYYGIAGAARDQAVAHARAVNRGPRFLADVPEVRRQVGLMEYDLRTAWWSLDGALDHLGPDFDFDPANVATVALARRCVVEHSVEVVNLAMDIVGGASYLRGSPLERAYRDIRAASYHSLTPEAALAFAGKVAVGRACHAD